MSAALGEADAGLVPRVAPARRIPDPRLFQIAALGGLLVFGVTCFDLRPGPWQAAVTLLATIGTQAFCSRAQGGRFDWRSPAVTGLSLTLLLRSNDPLVWAAAGAAGVGSKFVLRVRGKHLFNPACLAIVTMLASGEAWVSPGQWGTLAWTAAAIGCAAALVLSRAGRLDVAATFLATWAGLLALRCLRLGDPWTIPLHQMQSGALLIFGCFMITDPRSTPDSRAGRVLFAAAVAVLGHLLQFRWQVPEGLFYALMTVSVATPLLDSLLPRARFRWRAPALEV
jgi:Na+-transporting NADH:ubiquinone oxidoreductase subunit NqrB